MDASAEFLAIAFAFARLLLFVLPAWVANSSPVLLGGSWPIDKGKKLGDGRPLFGKSKTWLGLAAGISAGTLSGVLEAHLLAGTEFAFYPQAWEYAASGFLLSVGSMLGDLAGSFVKRRMGFPEGTSSFVLDQLAFIAVALAFVSVLSPPQLTPMNVFLLFLLTFFAHRMANWWAHNAGLKKVPW